MRLRIPTTQDELDELFGAPEDESSPLGEVDDSRFWRAVEIVRAEVDDEYELVLARDWEGCVCGLVQRTDGGQFEAPFDVLAFTHDGHVGHGGVNMPNYMDPEDLVASVKS